MRGKIFAISGIVKVAVQRVITAKYFDMARYAKKAGTAVRKAIRKMKKGALRIGRSAKRVTSRKQAVAIGLSEARTKGAKVPSRSSGPSRASRKKRR